MSSSTPAIVPSDTTQSVPSTVNGNGVKPSTLPKLPIPKLEDTCRRYLRALEGLQDQEEHARTKKAVDEFLSSGEGTKWQKKLEEYNASVDSYIEEFWCRSYPRVGADGR